MRYLGSDNVKRDLAEHLAYLERCAKSWALGGVGGKPDPEQAARVRAGAAGLRRHALSARVFTLDGEPVDIADFLAANPREDNPEVDPDAILRLKSGGEIKYGGGAAPLTTLRRIV